MAAQLKDMGRSSSVQFVRPKDFNRVLAACDNPPRASAALKDFVARGRELRKG
jgi:hypothetical protein